MLKISDSEVNQAVNVYKEFFISKKGKMNRFEFLKSIAIWMLIELVVGIITWSSLTSWGRAFETENLNSFYLTLCMFKGFFPFNFIIAPLFVIFFFLRLRAANAIVVKRMRDLSYPENANFTYFWGPIIICMVLTFMLSFHAFLGIAVIFSVIAGIIIFSIVSFITCCKLCFSRGSEACK